MFHEDRESIRESFEDFSSNLGDPRMERNKLHALEEILFLVLCAMISGSEGWRDIERYGKIKLDFLRSFFPYAHGIPSDDTIRRFFRDVHPKNFQICFSQWAQTLDLGERQHLAIDGKVSRHSFDGDTPPLHLVSAFATDCRLVLAQEKVKNKSNEITAIPKLLELLDIENGIITIDAMGCQKDIAHKIRDGGGDYIFSLKGNQGTLHEDVKLLFENKVLLERLKIDREQTIDGSEHGRTETRTYQMMDMPQVLKSHHNWRDLNTLIEVTSQRDIKGVKTEEKRYFISSLAKNAPEIPKAIRGHWAIENSLHWILDVTFRDDDSRIRKGNAPQNIAIIRHFALNLLQKTKGKRDSIKQLRKAAGWSNEQLIAILKKI